MIILGAGLSGLIAGNMLRRFKPQILEKQESLPNNHAALLRFRTDAVSNACAIPFKKVKVHKAVWYRNNIHNEVTIDMRNFYSYKVTGEYSQRSLGSLETVERYISPPDFIEQAACQLNISYAQDIGREALFSAGGRARPIISTVPMDTMMELANWDKKPEFKYKPIWTLTAEIPKCNVHQTIYYPNLDVIPYRVSITGNHLIIEATEEILNTEESMNDLCEDILDDFGMAREFSNCRVKKQKYGKILPIDDKVRKEFMLWLTKEHNIYSLGRFATWRQILLDDVVQDVNVIEKLMHGSGYESSKHWS